MGKAKETSHKKRNQSFQKESHELQWRKHWLQLRKVIKGCLSLLYKHLGDKFVKTGVENWKAHGGRF